MKYGSSYLSTLWQWCCEISAFAELPVLVSLCVSWLRVVVSIIYIIAGLSILREAYRLYEYHVITFALYALLLCGKYVCVSGIFD